MFLKRAAVFLLTILVCSGIYVAATRTIQASPCPDIPDIKECITFLEKELGHARSDKTNLTSQIKLMSTRVDLAKARINSTQDSIERTQTEIEELSGRIEKLNQAIDYLSKVLLQKMIEGYKNRGATLLEILLSEESSSITNQLKYIQTAQVNDQKLAIQTQQVKVNYSEQKDKRENKKVELEELETSLEVQKKGLDVEIGQKETLLEQTKNDESKFQGLLSQALAEFEAINKAISTGSVVGPVKKGDPIALVGNTGYPHCSTGAHLHFEVRRGGTWINPSEFIGDGKPWSMPLSEPIVMTQGYGVTPYSWRYRYSGGIHTGWDMISNSSGVIRAVADGTLYTSSQNCSGAIIKIKYIDHGSDVSSFYLHVQ